MSEIGEMVVPMFGTEPAEITGRMTIQYRLPCGCILSHSYNIVGSMEGQNPIKAFDFQHEGLAYWLRDRLPRHRCELVSPNNRNGIEPRPA